MQPISVDALLLRAQFPELTLRPGSGLVARVAARAESHGVIVLAGMPVTAQLPDEIAAGDTLKLTVAEVTPERIVLKLEPPPAFAPPVAPPPPPVEVGVDEPPRRRAGDGEETASVALSFNSKALGRLDLRIELGAGDVRVAVQAPRGVAFELAERRAGQLRGALEEELGGRATVAVSPRREPLDLYA